jgi:WD40 repeat protein
MSVDTTVGAESPTRAWTAHLEDYIGSLGWSSEGELVATASLGGDLHVLQAASGAERTPLTGHPGGALVVAWSHDGAVLASGGTDGAVRSWDRSTGAEATVVLGGGWVGDLAWSPGSRRLAAAAGRDVVLLNGELEAVDRWPDQPSTIRSLAWTSDGRQVGAGCYGGVRWFEPGKADVHRVFAWKGSLLRLAAAPNGKWLASGNQDLSVHLWRLWSGDELEMTGYPVKVEHLDWHHSSRWLAVGNAEHVTVWDVSGKGPRGRRPKVLGGVTGKVTALAWQPVGDLLAAGSSEGDVVLWGSVRARSPRATVSLGSEVSALAWSPDGTRLLAGTAAGLVTVVAV